MSIDHIIMCTNIRPFLNRVTTFNYDHKYQSYNQHKNNVTTLDIEHMKRKILTSHCFNNS